MAAPEADEQAGEPNPRKVCNHTSHEFKVRSNNHGNAEPGSEVPLIKRLHRNLLATVEESAMSSLFDNFPVIPAPPQSSSPATSSKTNDTLPTTDSSIDSPVYESFEQKNDGFACWLASQEFDASAIVVQNEEEGGDIKLPHDINVSVISDDFPLDALTKAAFSTARGVVCPPVLSDVYRTQSISAVRSNETKTHSETAKQSWWSGGTIGALLQHILADTCNCWSGTWPTERENNDVPTTNNNHDAMEHSDPWEKPNHSSSFVLPNQNEQHSLRKSPFQSKLDFNPLESYIHEDTDEDPYRPVNLDGRLLETPSIISGQSGASPLIGEYLITDSQDISNADHVDGCPAPPSRLPRKDHYFIPGDQDETRSVVSLRSLEERGLVRSDRMRRAKDRRRRRHKLDKNVGLGEGGMGEQG